ncbi:hypothetical protein Cpap_0886 [Ruminiclostridium papyrosolvens DSM 2782]|uniref:Uncharacterized protein n=1 Tax=Ruminiclostridium papyrosolvens DSM 2782 TaxID=588581 RepID=F1TH34_9FIRM|nr:hypothetical protein [Ruminiclostridium papyrosolvens]EGD46274.1 hypothetical protein Cpap_0886 [Ruminiclostridium papyrosolvens DSM 2782]WES33005.1 hypothetical protein P0092_14710 [Ruminiclostridium papyrosolvens DSM 2782]
MKKINTFCEDGTIYFHATNIEEFQKLIEDAKKQAQQLNETIDRLQNFKFTFTFEQKIT